MADIENFDVQELSDKVQEKFEQNKNTIYIALGAVALLVAGFWWYNSSKETKSLEASSLIWKQEGNFGAGNYQAAIDGDQNNIGYAAIADEYSGTATGEIAAYKMGVGYLNLGQYDLAINALEGVNFSDELVGAVAKGALGDAYLESQNVDKAISNYKSAVSHSNNDFTAPIYLKKLALAQELAGDIDDAIASYERIKNDFPTSAEAQGIEKFINKLKK
jgi:tetratricopeptide (TPR) repeat protein